MNADPTRPAGDLNTRNEHEPKVGRSEICFGDPCVGVVVSQCEPVEPDLRGRTHDLRRRLGAVRGVAVGVKVDAHAISVRAGPDSNLVSSPERLVTGFAVDTRRGRPKRRIDHVASFAQVHQV